MTKNSLDKSLIKFVLLEGVHTSAVDALNAAGYSNVEYVKTALSGDSLLSAIKDAHFLGIRSRTQLTEEVFAAASKLVGVGCFCIGTNQVDLKSAAARGIPVFNAPYSNTRSVAELVLAEAVMLLRGVPAKSMGCHRGEWTKSAAKSYEARGKTLGIVGYGNIGTQLSILAESLGMDVIFYDVVTKLPMGNARQVDSLSELLRQSDVVTLHVPETPATQWMIGEKELAEMKTGSVLINASRGTVVDINALAESLNSDHLQGAAIDVFPTEPKSNTEIFESPLRGIDNVILTPHVGGSTLEAQENIGKEVAEKLIRYSDNGTTLSAVNFPEVSLPEHPGKHRILHVHHNRPGTLNKINQVFADNSINIGGQYLQTDADIGYVVIEVDEAMSDLALQKVREVDGTIKARILF